MQVRRVGASLVVVTDLPAPASAVSEALRAHPLPGMREAVPSWQSVGIDFDGTPPVTDISRWLSDLLLDAKGPKPTIHRVDVSFDGEDLPEVSARLGLPADEVKRLMCAAEFRVEAVGFSPGFPYLSGLPPELCGLPRRAQPRPRVPAGSLAITGDQAGIYPSATPGGWNLIGTVTDEIFRLDPLWMRFQVGDLVHFQERA